MTLETIGNEMTRWASVLVPARQMAEVIADTEFVPTAMRGKPDVVTAAIMYGDELGIGPMQALQGIHVVEGKPQPSAELMRALVARAGHSIAIHEMSGHKARVSGLRAGRPEAERLVVEWNWDMAKAAGLTGKSNWRSYPRAMLLARATSDLARLLFPDVIKGLGYIAEDDSALIGENYAPEELRAPVAPDEPKPQRRKRPSRPSLPSPGHHLATEDKPGPDGSIDIPLPEHIAEPEPEPVPDLAPETTPEEPPPDDGEPPPPKAPGVASFKAMQAALGKALGQAPREDRLGALSAILGRELDSSSQVTRDECYRALDFLDRVNSGAAGLVKRQGEWQAIPYAEQPAISQGDDPTEDPWSELGGQG